jgi:hypothetical protein
MPTLELATLWRSSAPVRAPAPTITFTAKTPNTGARAAATRTHSRARSRVGFHALSRTLSRSFAFALGCLTLLLASTVLAQGPYWHVDTFNAGNLSTTTPNNHALWSGVPAGTAGYTAAPGYGNGWNDKLYWRATAANPTAATQVRLRFVYNHDTQPGQDFFRAEWEATQTFMTLLQIDGSNKNMTGQFVTPVVFDQTWIISPTQYAGPHHDQIVLRLRVVSGPSGSDQDGAYNTSGAVQVDNVLVQLDGATLSSADFESSGNTGGWTSFDRQAVADYIRDNVLGGSYAAVTMSMTLLPVDNLHIARDPNPGVPPLTMPFPLTWPVLIDDAPLANWAHPCRWVAVNANLNTHLGPLSKNWPPAVFANGGAGARVDLDCEPFTPQACPDITDPPSVGGLPPLPPDACLYAVLISGGWEPHLNHRDYRDNLAAVYQKLRGLGFARSNIWVYYADGSPLDLDDADGDGDHDTGSDVEGPVDEAAIRDKIRSLCDGLDPRRDVLFLCTTNHGVGTGDLVLWDFDGDGVYDSNEMYEPGELDLDTSDCQVCRLFVTMDQCYSGAFTDMATDGHHSNLAIYTAATADEVSWGRRYMQVWEALDFTTRTMNNVHQREADNAAYLQSTPVVAEGIAGNGDFLLNWCWADETCHVPWDTPLCNGAVSAEVEVQICNNLEQDHTYTLSLAGDPHGFGDCEVNGPSDFEILDPVPISVGAGECGTLRVRISRPPGLDMINDTACYTATVTNLEGSYDFRCRGRLLDRAGLCPTWAAQKRFWYLPPLQPRILALQVVNTGFPQSNMAYRFEAAGAEGGPNAVVSLNGLPPDTPVTGTVPVPPGVPVSLSVTAMFVTHDPDSFYDLRLLADVDGDGQADPLTSLGLRSSVATAAPPVRRSALRLRVAPNPFNPAATITFVLDGSAPTPVVLRVLDARGRAVRSLLAGQPLPPGPQLVLWDGRDDAGRIAASGVYVVQLSAPGKSASAKATLAK